ncbi:MAG: intradiol ring-cleavage dioxygenase [Deferribacteres bacterium]|nr:intradiol ring-cleavage dioxygenase [candidate division KSB1 bacterium]MCB9508657.1 intradiol ring-cleavage dioxygenase [Deferribacteres bacterium]
MIKKVTFTVLLFGVFLQAGQAQEWKNRQLVGACDGCEAVFEYGGRGLAAVDTLPDFKDPGPKLKLTGTIYKPDGKTPAADVILYIYHTDQTGVYPTRGDEQGWARRHGYLRGWIKTGNDGKYAFYTLKPASYPNRSIAAHVHPILLEPDGKYYWLGSYLFDDDPLLNSRERARKSPRGGHPGLLHLEREGELLVGKRDIILGRNVPEYR